MRRAPVVMLVFLAACGGHAAAPTTVPPGPVPAAGDLAFGKLADPDYHAYFEFNPDEGVSLGYHQYDGRVPDRSAAAIAAEVARLHRVVADLTALAPASLSPDVRVEREVLLASARDQLFNLEEEREPFTNPMYYAGALDVSSYISREYAPLAQRVRGIIAIAGGAHAFFAAARANLPDAIPRTWLDTALLQANGTIEFLGGDVRSATAALDQSDPQLAAELKTQLTAMSQEVAGFVSFLEAHRAHATDGFALGEQRFLAMLAETQGVTTTLATLRKIAEQDLATNLAAIETAAHAVDPSRPVRDVVLAAAEDRPTVGEILGVAGAQASAMRQFLLDHHVVSIPLEDIATVKESPPFMRWNSAFLDGAGLFEQQPLPSFYYISPPDPKWTAEEQRAYLPPRADLLFTTIHEVWPGHFLHGLHMKQNPSRILKSFCTYSTSEGWAHYTEEMMWDQGVAGDLSPIARAKLHIGQLKEALLRDVRFLAALGLHAGGMTVDDAAALFQAKAFADPATARQQAVRGTFDPMYLSYTIGKLMIRKLRDDWMAKQGTTGGVLAPFHDAFLSYGCAPIAVTRREMLGPDAGPPL